MAQGLVGAPVDPRYGQGAEVGQMQDYGYDTARNIADAITYITVLITIFIPLSRHKKAKLKQRILQHIGLALIPILVQMAGMAVINNYGGLGGGS
jgi:hypothetical protein